MKVYKNNKELKQDEFKLSTDGHVLSIGKGMRELVKDPDIIAMSEPLTEESLRRALSKNYLTIEPITAEIINVEIIDESHYHKGRGDLLIDLKFEDSIDRDLVNKTLIGSKVRYLVTGTYDIVGVESYCTASIYNCRAILKLIK
jgi:lambda repressor-like predicted transcriptional regulator